MEGLGQVAHNEARGRDDVDALRHRGQPEQLALAQHLLLAELVDAQALAWLGLGLG